MTTTDSRSTHSRSTDSRIAELRTVDDRTTDLRPTRSRTGPPRPAEHHGDDVLGSGGKPVRRAGRRVGWRIGWLLDDPRTAMVMTWLIGRIAEGRRRLREEPDAGYSTEAVLVTALLVVLAVVVIAIIAMKVTEKADSIQLG